jgi:hypothetical protein
MDVITIYLAGRFGRRDEFRGYADRLREAGVGAVRARWLTEDHEWDGAEDQISLAARLAAEDVEDLTAADLVSVFSEAETRARIRAAAFEELDATIPGHSDPMASAERIAAVAGRNRGGRHVEFGLALSRYNRGLCRLVVCGPAENVFHSLVPRFDAWPRLLAGLVSEARR